MSLRVKQRGFTLIEILIALAVFSVMSVMAYGGLKTVLDARGGTERAAERLRELQMAFMIMQQDMEHMAPRDIRLGYGDIEHAFSDDYAAEYQMTFTREGDAYAERPARSSMYRVAYQFDESEGELRRLVWSTLDRVDGAVPKKMVLLRGVSDFSFQVEKTPVTRIPGSAPGWRSLPKMVTIDVVLEDWGTITRHFAMPDQSS